MCAQTGKAACLKARILGQTVITATQPPPHVEREHNQILKKDHVPASLTLPANLQNSFQSHSLNGRAIKSSLYVTCREEVPTVAQQQQGKSRLMHSRDG